MSDTVCVTCGEKNTRIDAAVALKEITVNDAYCGHCGANWGVFVKSLAETSRRRKTRPVKKPKDFDAHAD